MLKAILSVLFLYGDGIISCEAGQAEGMILGCGLRTLQEAFEAQVVQ